MGQRHGSEIPGDAAGKAIRATNQATTGTGAPFGMSGLFAGRAAAEGRGSPWMTFFNFFRNHLIVIPSD
jgi:hypothetical protein